MAHPWRKGDRIVALDHWFLNMAGVEPGHLGTVWSDNRGVVKGNQLVYIVQFDGHERNNMGGPHTFQVDTSMVESAH